MKGTLTYESHGLAEPAGQENMPLQRSFEATVEDCKWTIRMILTGDANYSNFLSTYDGTNTIYVDKLNTKAFESRQKLVPGRLLQGCVVESSPVPRAIDSVGGAYVWLAFASGCYFMTASNGEAVDIHPLNSGGGVFGVRRKMPCRVTLDSTQPHLPVEIEYIQTNFARVDSAGKIRNFPLPAPFVSGLPALHLTSDAFTNLSGLSIPTRFEIKEYAPLPRATNDRDFRCTVIVRGTVTSISLDHVQQPNELASQVVHVTDLRSPASPMYVISNGIIPTADDPGLRAAKEQAIYRARTQTLRADSSTGNTPRVLLIVLGVLLILPLIFLFWKRGSWQTGK